MLWGVCDQTWLNQGRGGRVKWSFFLRDPVQRAVSGLRHHCIKHRVNPKEALAKFARGEPYIGVYKGLIPNQYVVDNFSSRMLSCPYGWSDVAFQQCTPNLELAKRMVSEAMSIGLTDRYLQSWCMFAFEMGDRPPQCNRTCDPGIDGNPPSNRPHQVRTPGVVDLRRDAALARMQC